MEAVTMFFTINERGSYKNFEWDYILVDNDKSLMRGVCQEENCSLYRFTKSYKKYKCTFDYGS